MCIRDRPCAGCGRAEGNLRRPIRQGCGFVGRAVEAPENVRGDARGRWLTDRMLLEAGESVTGAQKLCDPDDCRGAKPAGGDGGADDACCWEELRVTTACTRHPCGTLLVLSLIHISEPTRLLSISYAVFCLKKKKKKN
eukprot:TRINITY_DN16513_c0_g1_i1.p2 TRINITY_DN16513_c0_g1~~TRINITY_DN16513_c0_g1_i1.p2  ORF type:complete len:139 (-),score=26.84 TRINITY_DN16513_c0_g1_i1:88-504(-)